MMVVGDHAQPYFPWGPFCTQQMYVFHGPSVFCRWIRFSNPSLRQHLASNVSSADQLRTKFDNVFQLKLPQTTSRRTLAWRPFKRASGCFSRPVPVEVFGEFFLVAAYLCADTTAKETFGSWKQGVLELSWTLGETNFISSWKSM